MNKKLLNIFKSAAFLIISLGLLLAQDLSFKIAYTGSGQGQIGPCGCRYRNLGGLAERATLLDSLVDIDRNMLVLEAGNFAFSSANLSKVQIEKELDKSKLIARSYNLMPYNIINVGPHELAGGSTFLTELEKAAKNYDIISANIYDSQKNKPLFQPYKIERIDKKKIGIIGITSQKAVQNSKVVVHSPWEILESKLRHMRTQEQVDYIILLAALNDQDYKHLRKTELAVDIVLSALRRGRSSYLTETKGKIIARVGREGKYIGLLSGQINNSNEKLDNISYINYKKKYLERRLALFKKGAGDQKLDEYLGENERREKHYDNLVGSLEKMNARIDSTINPIDFKLIPVEVSTMQKSSIRKIINEYNR